MNLQALRESGKATLGQVSFDLGGDADDNGDDDKKNMIKMSTIVTFIQMPILEVDGKTCVQTGAIAR